MVTKADESDVLALGMKKVQSLDEALALADNLTSKLSPISVLPNAVAVVIRP
jgi:hypothetical protein